MKNKVYQILIKGGDNLEDVKKMMELFEEAQSLRKNATPTQLAKYIRWAF